MSLLFFSAWRYFVILVSHLFFFQFWIPMLRLLLLWMICLSSFSFPFFVLMPFRAFFKEKYETFAKKKASNKKTWNIHKIDSPMGSPVPGAEKTQKVTFLKKELCLGKTARQNLFFYTPSPSKVLHSIWVLFIPKRVTFFNKLYTLRWLHVFCWIFMTFWSTLVCRMPMHFVCYNFNSFALLKNLIQCAPRHVSCQAKGIDSTTHTGAMLCS